MEPALSTKVIKAVSLPDVNRTIDPLRLCDRAGRGFRAPRRRDRQRRGARLRDRQRGADQDRHRPRADGRRDRGARGRRLVAAARSAARHLGAARGRARLSRDVRQPGFRAAARPGLGRPQRLAGPHASRASAPPASPSSQRPTRPPDMRIADMVHAPCQGAGARAEGRARLAGGWARGRRIRIQAGDRPLAAPQQRVLRLRPRSSRPDHGRHHRQAGGRAGDRQSRPPWIWRRSGPTGSDDGPADGATSGTSASSSTTPISG